jgi:hypothetical protein
VQPGPLGVIPPQEKGRGHLVWPLDASGLYRRIVGDPGRLEGVTGILEGVTTPPALLAGGTDCLDGRLDGGVGGEGIAGRLAGSIGSTIRGLRFLIRIKGPGDERRPVIFKITSSLILVVDRGGARLRTDLTGRRRRI